MTSKPDCIPSWAKLGAKVVLVDAGPGDVGGPHDARVGDICIIDDVDMLDGEPVCLCHEENGRWILPDDTLARLSRFRPLTSTKTEVEDVALFRHHLTKLDEVQ
jgi:hypothetical protein